jgi:hypothetical protein
MMRILRPISGLVLPLVRRKVADIRAPVQNIKLSRWTPGRLRLAHPEKLSAAVANHQSSFHPVSRSFIGRKAQPGWQPMDLVLPNGAPSESKPASAQQNSTNDMLRRLIAQRNEQKVDPFPKTVTPAAPPQPVWKKPEPGSRIYRKIEEILAQPASAAMSQPPAPASGAASEPAVPPAAQVTRRALEEFPSPPAQPIEPPISVKAPEPETLSPAPLTTTPPAQTAAPKGQPAKIALPEPQTAPSLPVRRRAMVEELPPVNAPEPKAEMTLAERYAAAEEETGPADEVSAESSPSPVETPLPPGPPEPAAIDLTGRVVDLPAFTPPVAAPSASPAAAGTPTPQLHRRAEAAPESPAVPGSPAAGMAPVPGEQPAKVVLPVAHRKTVQRRSDRPAGAEAPSAPAVQRSAASPAAARQAPQASQPAAVPATSPAGTAPQLVPPPEPAALQRQPIQPAQSTSPAVEPLAQAVSPAGLPEMAASPSAASVLRALEPGALPSAPAADLPVSMRPAASEPLSEPEGTAALSSAQAVVQPRREETAAPVPPPVTAPADVLPATPEIAQPLSAHPAGTAASAPLQREPSPAPFAAPSAAPSPEPSAGAAPLSTPEAPADAPAQGGRAVQALPAQSELRMDLAPRRPGGAASAAQGHEAARPAPAAQGALPVQRKVDGGQASPPSGTAAGRATSGGGLPSSPALAPREGQAPAVPDAAPQASIQTPVPAEASPESPAAGTPLPAPKASQPAVPRPEDAAEDGTALPSTPPSPAQAIPLAVQRMSEYSQVYRSIADRRQPEQTAGSPSAGARIDALPGAAGAQPAGSAPVHDPRASAFVLRRFHPLAAADRPALPPFSAAENPGSPVPPSSRPEAAPTLGMDRGSAAGEPLSQAGQLLASPDGSAGSAPGMTPDFAPGNAAANALPPAPAASRRQARPPAGGIQPRLRPATLISRVSAPLPSDPPPAPGRSQEGVRLAPLPTWSPAIQRTPVLGPPRPESAFPDQDGGVQPQGTSPVQRSMDAGERAPGLAGSALAQLSTQPSRMAETEKPTQASTSRWGGAARPVDLVLRRPAAATVLRRPSDGAEDAGPGDQPSESTYSPDGPGAAHSPAAGHFPSGSVQRAQLPAASSPAGPGPGAEQEPTPTVSSRIRFFEELASGGRDESGGGPMDEVSSADIHDEAAQPAPKPDLKDLARQVYPLIKRMLANERERTLGRRA